MLQCEECGRKFEEPARYPDFTSEFWGAPFTKYYDGCPYCKSEEIGEEQTPALLFGSAVHKLILEPEDLSAVILDICV